jgi:hypothetical protein
MIDSFTINIRSSDERKQTKIARSIEWHRFPPPWLVEEMDACFVVMAGPGQKFAYVYFEDEQEGALILLGEAQSCMQPPYR